MSKASAVGNSFLKLLAPPVQIPDYLTGRALPKGTWHSTFEHGGICRHLETRRMTSICNVCLASIGVVTKRIALQWLEYWETQSEQGRRGPKQEQLKIHREEN